MAARRFLLRAALLAFLVASGCTSRDERASTAAALAGDALQGGDLATARIQIARALGARDDVSDYWLLSGRIALAGGQYAAAYDAFESALALDQSNVEALTRLCQLAAGTSRPERAERYAAQLAALRPGDAAALNVEAAIALDRGDAATATRLTDQVLAREATNGSALITRSRLLSQAGDAKGAAQAGEAALASLGDPTVRLRMLGRIYREAGDVAGYRRTIARLARAAPRSIPTQLSYAQTLYDAGDRAGGFAITRAMLAGRPGDVAAANAVLNLWRAQGAMAMPIGALVSAAADAVPETRATFAAYANSIHRPEFALLALGTTGDAEPATTATNDAKVARADAEAQLGRRAIALARLTAVLAVDPDQPRALALRGTLRAAAGDKRGALADLRRAVVADPDSAQVRLTLADLQLATGDGVLAAQTLAEGLSPKPFAGTSAGADDAAGDLTRRPDPRLASRLAQLLHAQGHTVEAAAVLDSYTRDYPFAPRPEG